MAKENDDSYLDDSTSPGKWTEVKLDKTAKVEDTSDEDSDPNADLYDDSATSQVAKKVAKAVKPPAEETEETEDDTAYLEDDDEDEAPAPAEETTEDTVEAVEEPATETVQPKNKVQKRFERLIEKLKSETAEKQQLEIEASIREAQLLQAIQELQAQVVSTTSTAASTKIREAEGAIESARRKLKAAKMNADDDAELEALEELADAKAMKREADAIAAQTPKAPEGGAAPRQPVDPTQVIALRKNQAWIQANQKHLTNPVVARTVQTVDAQLQQEGFSPADDEYRSELSKRSNKALATRGLRVNLVASTGEFDYASLMGEEPDETPAPAPVTKKKPINPMTKGAPSGGVKKNRTVARLDDSDKALAAKFGINPEVMLKQRALAARNSDTKNVPVYIPTKK